MTDNLETTDGFTLIEIVVVVTLLSILGTIAFFSFAQRTSQARDTLRKSDISSLSKSIGSTVYINTQNLGLSIGGLSLSHTFSTGSVYTLPISTGSIYYKVGTPNTSTFGGDKFLDPKSGDPYIIGVIQGDFGSYYQISASLESGKAITQGIYYKQANNDLSGIIKDPTGSLPIVDGGNILPY